MHFSTIGLFLLFQHSIAVFCPPPGAVLPPPHIPSNFAASKLTGILNKIVQKSQDYGWNATTNSFSVSATSRDKTFFSHHYTAPLKDESGVHKVKGDTVYRIASVTKLFTVLAVLLEERIHLNDSIGEYIKELNGTVWKDVTLRLLTSQLAALPRYGYAFDQAENSEDFTPIGFPPLGPSDIPRCGTGLGVRMCSRKEFFDSLHAFGFTGQLGDTPAYSNLAYVLLGFALEGLSGLKYEEVLEKAITGPLNLKSVGITPPPVEEAILPIDSGPWYGGDLGQINSTAGLYGSTDDLNRFLRSILNHELLSEVETNEWLKPAAFTPQLSQSVGAPWEIFRPTSFASPPRPIDHYTKSGDLPGFSSSYVVLVPEYNLGVTILGAGLDASTLVPLLLDHVQGTLIPELEILARAQAAAAYAGDYQSKRANASATLSLELDDGPGLRVKKWTNRENDMLKSFYTMLYGGSGDDEIGARFYPLGTDNRWRVGFWRPEKKENEQQGSSNRFNSLRGSACLSWMQVDSTHYGKAGIDEVVFRLSDDSEVEGIDIPALRARLDKN